MAVQGIEEPKQSNWLLPVGAGVVGAVGGATVLPGFAKYSKYEDLIKEATEGDSFKKDALKTLDNLDGDQKTAYETVKKDFDAMEGNLKKVTDAFKDGDKTVESKNAYEVAKSLGITTDQLDKDGLAKLKKEVGVAGEIGKLTKDTETEVPEAIKTLFKNGDNVDEAAMKEALKGVVGDAGVIEKDGKTFIKATEQNIKDATKKVSDNKKVLDFFALAEEKDGKFEVAASKVKDFFKKGGEGVEEAFGKIKGMLGKNKVLGAAVWGIGALIAAWGLTKLFGGKSDKA